jgi:hypothetical protein
LVGGELDNRYTRQQVGGTQRHLHACTDSG